MEFKTETCTKCGTSYQNHYQGEVADIMEQEHLCFNCAFWTWQHRLDQAGERDYAIIEGRHYVLAPHTDAPWPVGLGGPKRVNRIRFFDGREVLCDNLWHQGLIPEHFRDIMPDNAEFIQ